MLNVPKCRPDNKSNMEFEGSTTSSHDDFKANSVKSPEHSVEYSGRQNHVSSVVLHGIPIVSLRIDGKERLCLAQISNTLLKQFSYNEIHNRRVALGITCVQCTPVQLEILRRAGAMPISSRRCGMITKREAERLVKSFLEDNRPPKLPDNFYFEVHHKCGWGCKGKFEPSRYNSSRAKCIRCNYCNLYFSPNKFIFHFHRTAESKYNHPDAANFNSWRRHLHLVPGADGDDIAYAWEDVKAMFNGGSRKRMVSSPGFPDEPSPTTIPEPTKRPKTTLDEEIISKPSYPNQFPSYPLFSMPGSGKAYPYNPIASANPLALHYQLGKGEFTDEATKAAHLAYNPWRQSTDFILPPYDLLWASQFNSRATGNSPAYRQHFLNCSPMKELKMADNCNRHSPFETHTSSDDDDSNGFESRNNVKGPRHRPSAFRLVNKTSQMEETEADVDHIRADIGVSDNKSTDEMDESDVDVEVDVKDSAEKRLNGLVQMEKDNDINTNTTTNTNTIDEKSPKFNEDKPKSETPIYETESVKETDVDDNVPDASEKKSEKQETETKNNGADDDDDEDVTKAIASNNNDSESDRNYQNTPSLDKTDLNNLSKEELQRLLRNEMDVRKQVEGDIYKIKKGLEEQVNKEKLQRDEITKQLQVMKDALCNELEQERKTRLTMQQKLKEAHDALHNFSCKMFNGKQHEENTVKENMWQ